MAENSLRIHCGRLLLIPRPSVIETDKYVGSFGQSRQKCATAAPATAVAAWTKYYILQAVNNG